MRTYRRSGTLSVDAPVSISALYLNRYTRLWKIDIQSFSVPSRDHRIAAILLLFIGAFVGRILVNHVGSGATLGIGAGIRALVAISFWFVPAKVVKKP